MTRRFFCETALVFIIALILSAGSYGLRPEALPLATSASKVPGASEEETYKVISMAQAQQLFNDHQALFADARPLIAYEEGHIQGAIHLDPNSFDQWAPNLIDHYPLDKPIIAYCEGDLCRLSHDLAERLIWIGFEQVYYLVDGWGQWKQLGLPVEPTIQ